MIIFLLKSLGALVFGAGIGLYFRVDVISIYVLVKVANIRRILVLHANAIRLRYIYHVGTTKTVKNPVLVEYKFTNRAECLYIQRKGM